MTGLSQQAVNENSGGASLSVDEVKFAEPLRMGMVVDIRQRVAEPGQRVAAGPMQFARIENEPETKGRFAFQVRYDRLGTGQEGERSGNTVTVEGDHILVHLPQGECQRESRRDGISVGTAMRADEEAAAGLNPLQNRLVHRLVPY